MRLAPRPIVPALLLFVVAAPTSRGQGLVPPPPPPHPAPIANAAPGEAARLAQTLADRIQALGEEIAAAQGDAGLGRDVRELAQAADELQDTLRAVRDPAQAQRTFASVDSTWHHLQSELARRGAAAPAVERAAQRVDQADAQLHRALGLGSAGNLGELAGQMAQEVDRLGEDIAADLRQSPVGRHLIQDTQELGQSVAEFRQVVPATRDLGRLRQAYRGVDSSWHHLKAGLLRPEVRSPAVETAAARVDRVDAQLHQALGLNWPPAGQFGNEAPTGFGETQRLAYALESQADALAAAARANAAQLPNDPNLVQESARLARACDHFHDVIAEGQDDAAYQAAYQPVAQLCERLSPGFGTVQGAPQVQQVWVQFAATDRLMRQNLGLPLPAGLAAPVVGVAPAPPPAPGGPSSLVGLADQLVEAAAAFQQVFAASSPKVPERGAFLIDAERLVEGATAFRQAVGDGAPPNQLAFTFQNVSASWARLERRTDRIARGRVGPNIEQVHKIGDIVGQIRPLLGLPAAAPPPGAFLPQAGLP